MSNFNQSNQRVGRQSNAARDIVDNGVKGNHNTVNYHPAPLETIKEVWSITSTWFRSLLPERRDYSNIVQFDTKHYRTIERIENERLELGKIDSSRQADYQNRLIQLKEEERAFQEKKFEWEKSAVQDNLSLIRDSQNLAIEASQRNYQTTTDIHYLPLQVSREDTIASLSQDSGKFLIIPSPPKVLGKDVQAFESLQAHIPHELYNAIKKYYGDEITKSAIACSNILKGPIGETQALTVGKLIAPIPTLIFHSQVTHNQVIVGVILTLPRVKSVASQTQTSEQQLDIEIPHHKFSLPVWNWRVLKKELEEQSQNSDETILEIVSTIHLIVALYFCDLYCLNLNLNHSPKLFEFLAEPTFPDGLRIWSEPLKNSLMEAQKQIKEELDKTRALETAYVRQRHGKSYSDSSDFPVIGSVIGIMFLFVMCSQKSPNITRDSASTQSTIVQQQAKTGIIRADRDGYPGANLRATPSKKAKKIIDIPNGSSVVLGEVSSNGEWQRVTSKDGKSGWVWAEYIQR